MSESDLQIVIAGHVCLDILPHFQAVSGELNEVLVPGGLVEIGPSEFAAGGAVANTGVALHRLGMPVDLMGKIGDDLYGRALLDVLRRQDDTLAESMLVAESEHTSYTIVLSPPGSDRCFLHHTGANDTFSASDVPLDRIGHGRIFHFGYPPLMRQMYADGGREMAMLFQHVRAEGLFTSLDMAKPDMDAAVGRVDWRAWLANVLPHVDLFVPSLDEMRLMLGHTDEPAPTPSFLSELARELLEMGPSIVALKLGDQGLYLRTARDAGSFDAPLSAEWRGCELLAPCFEVDVVGTTGAGDCTVAGLLAGLAQGASPEEAITLATAVGACSVEHMDSTSGIPALASVRRRIAAGWPRRTQLPLPEGWTWDAEHAIGYGPGWAP